MELDGAIVCAEWALGIVAGAAVLLRIRGPVGHPSRRKRSVAVGVALCAFASLEWSKRIEPYFPEVTHTRVPMLDAPFRIVLLSDFHAGRMHREDLAKAVALANAEHPDVVLLAGDYISGYEMIAERAFALEGLRGLVARLGVLAVMGNHDSEPYGDDIPRRDAVALVLRGFGYQVLANESVELGPVVVVGLEDVQAGRTDAVAARRNVPAGRTVITLAHDWHALPPEKLDLGLVGHTHGGQICIPFTQVCAGPRRDRPFVRGLYVWPRGGSIFVTNGLGLAKAPVRFGCRPEVAVLERGRGP